MILCNGDYGGAERFGIAGRAAVAALVGSEAEPFCQPLCSSLSVIACPLGNKGAMAIARRVCLRSTFSNSAYDYSRDDFDGNGGTDRDETG